jgi:hypothetical protein
MIKNYHLFSIIYKGATNTQGSRVIIYSERFKQKITILFDYSYDATYEMAQAKLKELGYKITGVGETKAGYTLISTTFKPLK